MNNTLISQLWSCLGILLAKCLSSHFVAQRKQSQEFTHILQVAGIAENLPRPILPHRTISFFDQKISGGEISAILRGKNRHSMLHYLSAEPADEAKWLKRNANNFRCTYRRRLKIGGTLSRALSFFRRHRWDTGRHRCVWVSVCL